VDSARRRGVALRAPHRAGAGHGLLPAPGARPEAASLAGPVNEMGDPRSSCKHTYARHFGAKREPFGSCEASKRLT